MRHDTIEELAEDLAALIIWAVILLIFHLITPFWDWILIKFIMTVLLIYSIRDWFVDLTLFREANKANKINQQVLEGWEEKPNNPNNDLD